MKNIRNLVLSGAVLSLAATGMVFAQSGTNNAEPAAATTSSPAVEKKDDSTHGRRHGWMARMGVGNDGTIEKGETPHLERLKKADTDGDGTLSQQEIEAMVLNRMVEREARRTAHRLDIDGDGKVTIAEIEAHEAKRFALMDRNNDGKLDRREMRQAKKFDMGQHGKHDRHDGHRGKGFGSHGPRG